MFCLWPTLSERDAKRKRGAERDVGGWGGFMRSVVHREPTVSLPEGQSLSISTVNPCLAILTHSFNPETLLTTFHAFVVRFHLCLFDANCIDF